MQERLWKVMTTAYQEGGSSLMKRLMKMHMERGAAAIRNVYPDMAVKTSFHVKGEGSLMEGGIAAAVYTAPPYKKDGSFASISCSAIPIRKGVSEGRHLWQMSFEDIVRCSEASVRAYLCRSAVTAAMQAAPYIQGADGSIPDLKYTSVPEDVKTDKEDVLTASMSLPDGREIFFTAQPCGEDAKRFLTIHQTDQIREMVSRHPDLPVIIASDTRLPDDVTNIRILPDVSCYRTFVLDYDLFGNGTVITDHSRLPAYLRQKLAEKYEGDPDGLERAVFAEEERLRPYWREAILIRAGQ